MRIPPLALLILAMADAHSQSPSFEDFREAFIAGDVQQVDALEKVTKRKGWFSR